MRRLLLSAVLAGIIVGCSKPQDSSAPTTRSDEGNATAAQDTGSAPDRAEELPPQWTPEPKLEVPETVDVVPEPPVLMPPRAPSSSAPDRARRTSPRATTMRPRGRSGITTVRVFYGTNRRPTGKRSPNDYYGPDRGKLVVGFCDVSIPPNHERGELEAPSIWKLEFSESPSKHVMLRSIEPVSGKTFLGGLRETVQSSIQTVHVGNEEREIGGEAFVFVHGYNVTFKDAARRAAQMAYDLEFPGAPVMFSWPSIGKGNLKSYREDERTAEWCEEHLMDFVTLVARGSKARRIHLIAHSMGNRILTGVMRRLAYAHRTGSVPRFNQVILTAPDIDAQTFKLAIAPRIKNMADRFTVYASSNDVALKASEMVHSGGSRLGQGGSSLMTFPQYPHIDMVDASNVDTSLFAVNHSYYGDSPTVLNDISNVLIGAKAESRGLRTMVRGVAWKVPERLRRLSRLSFDRAQRR